MMGFSKAKMADLCEITSSKRIFAADYVSEGVPFYRGKEITEKYKGNLDVSTELFITEEKFCEIERKFGAPREGDLLLTSVGTLGSPYVVKQGERFYFKDGNLTWFRNFSELDSKFLYHWLVSPQGKAELQKCTIGSSQSAFTIVLLKSMEIKLPPLTMQRHIASILSAYDELIENNQRRIRILEDMARSLYREWFVHFRYPGFESVPLVASPLGQIPQGWEVATFGEIYNTSSGGTPSRQRPDYFENGAIDWVKSQELLDGFILSTDERITECALNESSAKIFPADTVLIALYGATIGKLAITSREAATNQACCAVLPKRAPFGREFAFLMLRENRERIIGLRLGAAQQNISQVLLKNLECLKPNDQVALRFSELISPLFDGILTLQRQTANLRSTRDLLLPRLLSGTVKLAAIKYELNEVTQ
jgi:type I restriction enzyme S subunit